MLRVGLAVLFAGCALVYFDLLHTVSLLQFLQRLLAQAPASGPWRFLEDRRLTLEAVRALPALDAVHCLLVTWGYLRPGDAQNLPAGIKLLEPEVVDQPLAQWPAAAIVQAN